MIKVLAIRSLRTSLVLNNWAHYINETTNARSERENIACKKSIEDVQGPVVQNRVGLTSS